MLFPFLPRPDSNAYHHHGGDYGGTISDTLLYILITPILTGSVMKIMNLQYSLYNAGQAIDRMESLTQGTEPHLTPRLHLSPSDMTYVLSMFHFAILEQAKTPCETSASISLRGKHLLL